MDDILQSLTQSCSSRTHRRKSKVLLSGMLQQSRLVLLKESWSHLLFLCVLNAVRRHFPALLVDGDSLCPEGEKGAATTLHSDRDQGWPMPCALSCSQVTLLHLRVPGCSWKSRLKQQAWVAPRSPWGWEGKVNKILLSTAETNCSSVAWQMGPKRETICF